MFRFLIAHIILLSTCSIFGQEIYSIDQKQMNSVYVDSILAPNHLSGTENPLYQVNKAIHIAESITYTSGVQKGYRYLIEYYKKQEDTPLELRNLLLYTNYLEKINEVDELRNQLYKIGNIYYSYELNEKALENYLKSDSLVAKVSDTAFEIKLDKQICLTQMRLKNYTEADQNLSQLKANAEQLNDWNSELWALQQKGRIKHVLGKYEAELKISKEIVDFADKKGLKEEKITAINNLAYVYRYLKQYDDAIAYLEPLLSNQQTETDAFIYQNIAILYQNQQDLPHAKENFLKALEIHKKNKNYYYESYLLDFIALMNYQESDFHNALIYNEKSIDLSKKHEIGDVYQSGYYTRALIDQGLYEYEDALTHMNRHLVIKDSLQTIKDRSQSKIELQQLFLDRTEEEVQLHFVSQEIKDLEIKRLMAERDADEERLKRFESDSLLTHQQFITQALQLKEIRNQLELQKQALSLKESENEVRMLAEQKEKQALALQLEKIERQKQEKNLLLEKKNGEILKLELNERAAFTRNLIYFLFGLLLIILLIILFYLNLRKRKREIDAQRILIAAERDKADKLLLNILPISVAEELKEKGKSIPRHYDVISIIFTDFAGFTKISEKLSPVQLVEKLDEIFLQFDLIVEKYGLNRIKTIGDAYMCAAGLPEEDPKHAENAVRAAMEMRDYVDIFNTKLPAKAPKWNIRIGINTGPVVAGVVGIRKFAYDIWGDAVNVAARMESSGEISKVNISESTYELVKNKVKASHRGKIYAKNKGEIDMYFIDEIN
ncbi:MAG: tetratricopeptide repeat protein [Crocinitomix sp.]|nr:tetratricopeptide repeat protein [Crocinitomix sp.]